ncbi:MAG: phosphoadenylyl-sulfate reductase [Parvularculaceae bacterium]|nr:phosphoadenylyl-sulfate reductase [Parvularculaceae bacterium]
MSVALASAPETPPERAARLEARFGSSSAIEVIAASRRAFGSRLALVSSFGAESAALLHLVARVDPKVPVIFLDTGKHFVQTSEYRRTLADGLGLRDVRDIHPKADELAGRDPRGDLWRRDADACCDLRKVRPLAAALEGFDAWITGRKQFHGGLRAALPAFESAPPFVKINPIARWSPEDLARYASDHNLPAHPLVAEGYPSIGCWPCTHPVAPGDGPRDGRWRGSAKTECGIHKPAQIE